MGDNNGLGLQGLANWSALCPLGCIIDNARLPVYICILNTRKCGAIVPAFWHSTLASFFLSALG
jgi:hypothetical protein